MGSCEQAVKAVMRLSELNFTDLYLGEPRFSYLSDLRGAQGNPAPAPKEIHAELGELYQEASKAFGEDFTDDRQIIHDGVSYRVSALPSARGAIFVFRRMADHVPTFQELGIPSIYRPFFLDPGLRGLLLIVGQMKSGKTSTASAIISERLKVNGGVAATCEDPPEFPLDGVHGKGICYQTHVRMFNGYAGSARQIMRWGLNTVMLGEIRDSITAVEALRAAVNGHLVISTLHAEDPIAAITRLRALVGNELREDSTGMLLSEGLCGIFGQHLNGTQNKKVLELEALFVRDEVNIKSVIRSQHHERLRGEMKLQKNRLIQQSGKAL